MKYSQMQFTTIEKQELDRRRRSIDVAARLIEQQSDKIPFSAEEYPHVWKRLAQIRSMTREELLQEVEADYLLFEFTQFNGENGFEFIRFKNEAD